MGRVLTLGALAADMKRRLEPAYGQGEAQALVREIMLRVKGLTPTAMAIDADKPASEMLADKANDAVERLLGGEPVQYIFGRAYFHGLDLEVTPAVLIPRPETSELVDMIADRYAGQSDLRVADLCTGSGCIACALARTLPFAEVTAVDLSADALAVAKRNASALGVKVAFEQADVLAMTPPAEPLYDIVVSNPPYVLESERAGLDANVLREPAMALFVPDSDPLRFYKAISSWALRALKPGGTLWLEGNPKCASELASMMRADGWADVEQRRDSSARMRFTIATCP